MFECLQSFPILYSILLVTLIWLSETQKPITCESTGTEKIKQVINAGVTATDFKERERVYNG